MATEFDFSSFSRELESRLSVFLDPGPGFPPNLLAAARHAQQTAEAALAERPFPSRAACGPGCGHCCVVNVAVLEPEAALAVDHVRETFGADRRAALRERIEELFRRIRWLEDEDRPLLREPCAFLDERENCAIHAVRPLLCRGVTSTDPERCRDAIALQALGEPPTVLSDLFQARLFQETFRSLGRCLERAGLEARSRPLTEAVLARLDG